MAYISEDEDMLTINGIVHRVELSLSVGDSAALFWATDGHESVRFLLESEDVDAIRSFFDKRKVKKPPKEIEEETLSHDHRADLRDWYDNGGNYIERMTALYRLVEKIARERNTPT